MIVDLRKLAGRLRRRYEFFPALIITGETASEALREANEGGFTVLQKPIAP
jgi:hypothetical protein